VELRSANLSMTMSEIANNVGVSRQRVFQILQEEGLPTKHHVIIEKSQYQYQCLACGTISPRKFCSDECKKKWQQVPVVCTRCGKLFFRNITQLLHNYHRHDKGLFCSKHCAAKWLAEIYGFKSCVNRMVSSGYSGKRKCDHDMIWKTHLKTGYRASQLSKRLHIPKSTIYAILSHCWKESRDVL
jgi:Zn finger protein HypA/HybF involved in hydrogenase expression